MELFRQEQRGRPGKDSRFRRTVKARFHVVLRPGKAVIAYDAKSDGMFPLLTNEPKMSPMQLKNIDRVEALIEREVRQPMEVQGMRSIPLYPEGRLCLAPTTDRILCVFEWVAAHHLERKGREAQRLAPKLTEQQLELLRPAGVPEESYAG